MFTFFKSKSDDEIFLENYKDDFLEYKTFEHLLSMIDNCKIVNKLEHLNKPGVRSFFQLEFLDKTGVAFITFTPNFSIEHLISRQKSDLENRIENFLLQVSRKNKDEVTLSKEIIWTWIKLISSKYFWIKSYDSYDEVWFFNDLNVTQFDYKDSDYTYTYWSKGVLNDKPNLWLTEEEARNLIISLSKCSTFNTVSKVLDNIDTIKHSGNCILNTSNISSFYQKNFWAIIQDFVLSTDKYTWEQKSKFLKEQFSKNIRDFTGTLPEYINERIYARLYTWYFKEFIIKLETQKKLQEEERKQKELKAEEERKLKNYQSILKLKSLDKDLQENIKKSERILEIREAFLKLNDELSSLQK